MMLRRVMRGAFASACALLVLSAGASAAGYFTNGVPLAAGPLTGKEVFPADTNVASPPSEAISTTQAAAYSAGLPSRGNALIGGDAGTNLFQRGTAGASVTTTIAYGGPDRWAYWSGTATPMTVSRDTSAGDLPLGYSAAFKMSRSAGASGVVTVCMAQEIASVNSAQFAGQVAELDFHATTGANYSPANANMMAFVVTGSGIDEGISALAFGLNTGGGGSVGWTGQASVAAATISLGGLSKSGRYVVVVNVPASATELAVVLCDKPSGTAGMDDYIAFAGIQLVRNPTLAAQVSPTTGFSCGVVACTAFQRRLAGDEAELQLGYFFALTEAAVGAIQSSAGYYDTTTTCSVAIPFPALMRAAPTFAGVGLSSGTFKIVPGSAAVPLATPFAATKVANSSAAASVSFTTAAETAFAACELVGNGGAGQLSWSAEL